MFILNRSRRLAAAVFVGALVLWPKDAWGWIDVASGETSSGAQVTAKTRDQSSGGARSGGAQRTEGNSHTVASNQGASASSSSGGSGPCVPDANGLCKIEDVIFPGGGAAPGAAAAAAPPPDPQVVARQAIARIELPASAPEIGPDPSTNEWNMMAVGYPIWLWSSDPATVSRTVTEQGITINLTARRTSMDFAMGDGHTESCATSTPWHSGVTPGTPSPTCGYRYPKPSRPGPAYQLRAEAQWEVAWSAMGQNGIIPVRRSSPTTPLVVGELHAVRTR